MKMLRKLLLAAAIAFPAVPTVVYAAPASELNQSQRTNYREIFAAIRAGDWANAAARLDGMGDGPLHHVARAELYLAKGSPRVELEQILPLLARAPDMPQAAQLARLAETRGATDLPPIPQAQNLAWAGSQPRRARARPVKGDPIADSLEPQIQPLIVADQPAAAEALLQQSEFALSNEALTSFRQRIAWAHYLIGNYTAARTLALRGAREGSTEWAVHAEWVAALAAWRMNDCREAGQSFSLVGSRSGDQELSAAGHYWAARADMMCAHPERVQAHLRNAARHRETFYGLIAASALGIKDKNYSGLHDYRDPDWRRVAQRPNVRAAVALADIGEMRLADEFIRHQARIGGAADHDGLLHLAETMSLASTQYWLAHNAPRGTQVNASARYPMPNWQPTRGWRVDPSLAFAHALQESSFRAEVVSPAGATGVMQVRPGTAGDMARKRGEYFSPEQLKQPSANIEYGQSYLEYLRDYPSTGGLLPKVIASYNAGPAPISEWNARPSVMSADPLLYIESIPYWETRGYVPIVLRNYWIYEQKAGKGSTSRQALAQGMWPRFPGMPGATAVRMNPVGGFAQGSN
ncbi:MAG TPA: lytic transglycosylase domain-containing protein [Allosphingosinicella sp.]|uniref:lytic transglycosylase domain-containing protein n=1 Tax=Allosphingosinicella sp. TaxID=2823234 RepID=UPI002EDB49FE